MYRPIRLAALLTLAACASPAPAPVVASAPADPAAPYRAIVAADRSDDDKQLDAGRKPVELLTFLGVRPGMHVADLAAGTGYTTELLARAVGPSGVVYGQNIRWVLEKFAEKGWSERLQKPVNKLVVRVDRELDDPLPPEAHDLDLVTMVLFYHDSVWLEADRSKLNAAVFKALKPGGAYVIVDHSGQDGSGTSQAQSHHRIEERVVRDEVTAAGFQLAEEGSFLRNPADTRDWNDSPRAAGDKRGTSDRFVLKFIKPIRS